MCGGDSSGRKVNLALQPDIYIAHGVRGGTHISDKSLRDKGPLHRSHLNCGVTRIEMGAGGVYHTDDLDISSHWSELRSARRTIAQGCDVDVVGKWNAMPNRNRVSSIHTDTSGRMIGDLSTYNEIDFEGLARSVIERKVKAGELSERGNYQFTSGFTNLNLKVEELAEVTKPQVVRSTTKSDVVAMCQVTSLMRELCKLSGRPVPFSSDLRRLQDFPLALCRQFGLEESTAKGDASNLLEAMSVIVSIVQHPQHKGVSLFGKEVPLPSMLVAHFDRGNCPFPGFTDVFVPYKHIFLEEYSIMVRVALVGFAKKASSDYYRRLDGARHLKTNVKAYFDHVKADRLFPSVPMFKNNDPIVPCHTIPHLDKGAGFNSAAAHILEKLCFECKPHWFDSLESVCEVILPFAFVVSYANLYKAFHRWSRLAVKPNKTGSGNLFLEVMKELVDVDGGINRAPGPRMTVSCNYSMKVSTVMTSLCILRAAILHINSTVDVSYAKAEKLLIQIHGVQGLGAQHLLSILSLTGVINRPCLGACASVCVGTKTYAKLKETYHLPEASINKVYLDLSRELGISVAIVENTVCEFFRDNVLGLPFDATTYDVRVKLRQHGRAGLFPDTFFFGQRLYQLVRSSDNGWKVVRHNSVGHTGVPAAVTFKPLEPGAICPWSTPGMQSMANQEVKVSIHSKLRVPKSKAERELLCPERKANKRKTKASSSNIESSDTFGVSAEDCLEDKFVASIPRTQRLVASCTTRTTRSGNFSFQNIAGATREAGTYQYFDPVTTAVRALSTSVKPCKKLSKYFRTRQEMSVNSRTMFTTTIGCNGPPIRTFSNSWAALHHDVVDEIDGVLYYSDKETAKRAVVLQALLLHSEIPDDIPSWVERYLPTARYNQPSRDFCVLYVHKPHNVFGDEMFGVLCFRGCERVLRVPADSRSFDCGQWQEFSFASNKRIKHFK